MLTSENNSSYPLSYNISHWRMEFCLKIRFLYYVAVRLIWTLHCVTFQCRLLIVLCTYRELSQRNDELLFILQPQLSVLFQEAFYLPPSFHVYFYQSILCAIFVFIPILFFHLTYYVLCCERRLSCFIWYGGIFRYWATFSVLVGFCWGVFTLFSAWFSLTGVH